jgi:hypothetical protein
LPALAAPVTAGRRSRLNPGLVVGALIVLTVAAMAVTLVLLDPV